MALTVDSLENVEENFENLSDQIQELLNPEGDSPDEKPDFKYVKDHSPSPIRYEPAEDAVLLNKEIIGSTPTPRNLVGGTIAEWLREVQGEGDQLPEYLPESSFFRHLGRLDIVNTFPDEIGYRPTFQIYQGGGPANIVQDITRETVENGFDEVYETAQLLKEGVSEYAWRKLGDAGGFYAAADNYEKISESDENILGMTSKEVRERFTDPRLQRPTRSDS